LHARFRDHSVALFDKHGLELVGFWEHGAGDGTLVYLLAFDSRTAADAAWEAFRTDPEWIRVRAQSEQDGILTAGVESVFMDPTDYSPIE
jgi:hypothetical protein